MESRATSMVQAADLGRFSRHTGQFLIFSVISTLILGQNNTSRALAFVLLIPRCPSCSFSSISPLKLLDTTIFCPFTISPLVLLVHHGNSKTPVRWTGLDLCSSDKITSSLVASANRANCWSEIKSSSKFTSNCCSAFVSFSSRWARDRACARCRLSPRLYTTLIPGKSWSWTNIRCSSNGATCKGFFRVASKGL